MIFKKYFLNILICFFLGVILFFLYQLIGHKASFQKAGTYTVAISDYGFSPNNLAIHQGDTVRFINKGKKQAWPASDPHPTHGIYPEFDPRQPIDPGQSWHFKFDKVGNWGFHDHLNSLHVGTIVVLGQQISAQDNCSDPSTQGSQLQCWQKLIKQTLQKEGLPAAFDTIANLYATQPVFAAECHSFTHELGQEAYGIFAAHQNFELNSKTSYCGFGFYHGFMETLLHSTNDIKQAQEFCRSVGEKLAGQTTDGEGACYHGIGHGAVDGTDISAWGDPQKMLNPGLKICDLVAGDDYTPFGKLYRCVSGAYNALEILSADSKYKLTMIQKNPFYICPTQPLYNQEACYTNMLPSLLRLTDNDTQVSEKIIEKIIESGFTIRSSVTSSLFHEFIRLNLDQPNYNFEKGINICHTLSDPYRISCIDGLSGGHMKYGEPRQEYVKGLAFCGSPKLTADEQNECYRYILSRLRIWYSPAKTQEICGSIEVRYQKYCLSV